MYNALYFHLHLVAPEILSEIVDLSDEGRGDAHFKCRATGEPIPDISWHFNGVVINDVDTGKYRLTSTVINSTTIEKALIVYNITSADSNVYTCDASNRIGNDINHGKSKLAGYNVCNN